MSIIDPVEIKKHFPGIHLPTIKNLLCIVEAIIEKRTTNINHLKDVVGRIRENNSFTESHYKRLIRFF